MVDNQSEAVTAYIWPSYSMDGSYRRLFPPEEGPATTYYIKVYLLSIYVLVIKLAIILQFSVHVTKVLSTRGHAINGFPFISTLVKHVLLCRGIEYSVSCAPLPQKT